MFHVEPGEAGSGPSCPCCGLPGRSAFGFVQRGRESIAFYYAWLDPHRERRIVSLAISLGDWSQGGDPSSRVAAAVQFESNGEDVSGRFLAPESSLFSDRDVLGRFLTLAELPDSSLRPRFLEVAEAIVLEDPEVNGHLMS